MVECSNVLVDNAAHSLVFVVVLLVLLICTTVEAAASLILGCARASSRLPHAVTTSVSIHGFHLVKPVEAALRTVAHAKRSDCVPCVVKTELKRLP